MPIYRHGQDVYDIPNEEIEGFEAQFPEATVEMHDGEDIYDIPVSEKDGFLSQYPTAIYSQSKALKTAQPVVDAKPQENQESDLFKPQSTETPSLLNIGAKPKDYFAEAGAKAMNNIRQERQAREYHEIMKPLSGFEGKEQKKALEERKQQIESQLNQPGMVRNAAARTNMAKNLENIDKELQVLNEQQNQWSERYGAWTPSSARRFREQTIEQTWYDPYAIVPEEYKALATKQWGKEGSEDAYFSAWMNLTPEQREAFIRKEHVKSFFNEETTSKMQGIRERATTYANNALSEIPVSVDPRHSATAMAARTVNNIGVQTTKALDKAEEIKQAYKNHQLDENFFTGAYKGMKDGLTDIDNWTGIYMIGEMTNLYDIADKMEKGVQLSQAEEDFLDAQAYKLAVEAALADDLGWGYKSGNVTGASIPFMLQMLASPIGGASGKAIDKGFAAVGRRAIDKFGKGILKKLLTKAPVKKVAKGLVGTVGKGIGQTILFGSDRVAAGTMQRHLGNEMVAERANEEFNAGVQAKAGEDWGTALFKEGVSASMENISEFAGSAFIDDFTKAVGKTIAKEFLDAIDGPVGRRLANAASKQKANKIFQAIANNKWGQHAVNISKSVQNGMAWDGLINEYLEEVLNNAANVMIGDMSVEDFTSLEKNAETILGLAWTSGFFTAQNAVNRVGGYIRGNIALKRTDRAARQIFTGDMQEKWNAYTQALSQANGYEEVEQLYKGLIADISNNQDKETARAQITEATAYMTNYVKMMGMNAATEEAEEEEPKTPAQQEVESAQGEGIAAHGTEKELDVVEEMEQSYNQLAEHLGGTNVEDWLLQYGETADKQLEAIRGSELDEQTKAMADTYLTSAQRYEGLLLANQEEVDAIVAEAAKEFDANVNQELGSVIQVLTTQDKVAYVIQGNPNEREQITLRYNDGSMEQALSKVVEKVLSESDAQAIRGDMLEGVRKSAIAEIVTRMQGVIPNATQMQMPVGHNVVVDGQAGVVAGVNADGTMQIQMQGGNAVNAAPQQVMDAQAYNDIMERKARAREGVTVSVPVREEAEVPTSEEAATEAVAVVEEMTEAQKLLQEYMDESVSLEDRQAIVENNVAQAKQAAMEAQAEFDAMNESKPQAKDYTNIAEFKQAQEQWKAQMQEKQQLLDMARQQEATWNEVQSGMNQPVVAEEASEQTDIEATPATPQAIEDLQAEAKNHNSKHDIKALAKEIGVSAKRIQRVIDFANQIGVKLNFANVTRTEGDKGAFTNADNMSSKREITMSKYMLAKGMAIEWVMGHELTHQIKADGNAAQWETYKQTIINALGQEAFDKRVKSQSKVYSMAGAYKNMPANEFMETMEEEVCADAAGDMLLNPDNMNKVMGVPQSLASRIWNGLKNMVTFSTPSKIKQAVDAWQQLAEGKMLHSIVSDQAGEQLEETASATRYSIVVDPQLIAELEASPKRKGYRNVVQREDGLFEAPMGNSLRGNGITVENTPFAMGQWEQSEEHPELVYGDNKITLVKPDGKTVADVNYNPYIHNRLNTLNAQFKQAWERPDLVYVETEVPVTDLESAYQADKAHLSTGVHQWSNGALMLSRYDKPVRIVPWDEVAIPWIEKYKKSGVHFDIVPPALRPILAEAGVKIKEPHANMGEKCTKAYEEWKAEQDVNANVAESNVEVTNEEVKKNSIPSVNSMTEAAGRLEENVGEVDTEKGDVRYSVHDILRGKERENAIKDLMTVTGRSRATVLKWLKAEESLAKVILDEDNVALLDIEADESVPSIWNNSDYPQGTVEFSNICKKRLPFTTIYQRLQKEYPNMVFDAQTLNTIRETMKDAGKDVACALCFVEDRRQLLGEIGQGFIDAVQGNGTKLNDNQKAALKKLAESGDRYVPNLYDILTLDGMKKLRREHPAVAQAFIEYNNARGMQAGRLFQAYSAYNREILKYSDKKVKSINDNGGLRIFSFSDFEAHHLIDLVQVLTDCAAKGIKVQGYTKVPAFAKAVKDTGAKINRSLIPKGVGYVDADYVPKEGEAVSPNVINGKRLLFDTVEGIDVNDPNFFDSTSSKSVGNILVVINDEHARLAMADPFVDYLIGFHTGQAKEILKGKGIDTWVNYKNDQMDKVETTDKNGSKKLTNAPNHGINIYTDVLNVAEAEGNPIKTAKQFTERFLEECNKRGYVPRFYRFLNRAKDGRFLYTPGYHKFLPDFKLFDKNGKILTQEPVMPIFDNEFNKQILEDYVRDVKEELPLDNVYEAVKEAIGLGGKMFSISAYHGSAAEFDKFDRNFAGSGEGQAVMGVGHYVTTSEGTGRYYAEVASDMRRKVVQEGGYTYNGEVVRSRSLVSAYEALKRNDFDVDKAIESIERGIMFTRRIKGENANTATSEKAIEYLNEEKAHKGTLGYQEEIVEKPARHLYEVEIPDDNGKNYFDLDKKATKKTKEEAKKRLLDALLNGEEADYWKDNQDTIESMWRDGVNTSDATNNSVRGTMEQFLTQEEVSDILSDMGYVGSKSQATDGTTYIIYNDADVKIKNHTKFSLSAEEIKQNAGVFAKLYSQFLDGEYYLPSYAEDAINNALDRIKNDLVEKYGRDPQEFFGNIGRLQYERLMDAMSNEYYGYNIPYADIWMEEYADEAKEMMEEMLDYWSKEMLQEADNVESYIPLSVLEAVSPKSNAYNLLSNDVVSVLEKVTGKSRSEIYEEYARQGDTMLTDEDYEALNAENADIRYSMPARMKQLEKAENFIRRNLKAKRRGLSFEIYLPVKVEKEIRKRMGRDFESHNITINGVAHGLKNHGVNGTKLTATSIPVTEENATLIPYIMVAPDRVEGGSTDASGRESIRFIKNLSNGVVVVVEKEYKNSPDDMETINIWADLSSEAINAQQKAAPGIHVQNAILDIDVAKIRKDAEEAIRADVEYLQKQANAKSGEQNKRSFSLPKEVTLDDYYLNTMATFDPIVTYMSEGIKSIDDVYARFEQLRKDHPEWEWHKSPKYESDSEYLIDRENGDVYRYSNHWGRVASCTWKLDFVNQGAVAIGKANITDFERKETASPWSVRPGWLPRFSLSPIPGRMQGESIMDYAQRVAAEVERQRRERLETIASTLSDPVQTRWKRLYDRVRNAIDDKNVRRIDKSTLTAIMRTIGKGAIASSKGWAKQMDAVEDILTGVELRTVRDRIDELLNVKTTAVNQRGIETGKGVDPETQKVLERLRNTMSLLKHHAIEDQMHELRSQNWHIRNDVQGKYAEWSKEEKDAKIAENNEKLRELKPQLRAALDDIAIETVESIDAEIQTLTEKVGTNSWNESDDVFMEILQLRKQMAEYNKSFRETMELERTLDETWEERRQKRNEKNITEDEQRKENLGAEIKNLTAKIRGLEGIIKESRKNTLDGMTHFATSLEGLIKEGRENLGDKIRAEVQRRATFLRNAMHDVNASNAEIPTVNTGEEDKSSKLPWYKALYANAVSNFDYMLQKIATRTLGQDSWLYQQFMLGEEGVMAANSTYIQGLQQAKDTLDAKAMEIFGKEYKKVMKDNAKVQETGIDIINDPEAERLTTIPLKLSKGQATYIYMLWKMADGRAKLLAQGFDEDIMASIEEYIGEKNKQWADWVQDEYLPNLRVKYNERYREMFNTDMAAIENYVPIKISGSSIRENVDLTQVVGNTTGLQTKNGSLIKRVANVKPIDLNTNAMELILDHVTQMEEFYAYAPIRRDLQYILSSTAFKNRVNANSAGDYGRLLEAARIAVRASEPPVNLNDFWSSALSKIQKGLVSKNIAYRSLTAIKQALATPAFYAYSQNPEFIWILSKNIVGGYARNLAPFLTTPLPFVGQWMTKKAMDMAMDGNKVLGENFRWCLENIPSFRDRVLKNSAGDIRLEESSLGNVLDKFTELGMAHNVFVDALTVSIGLKSIYDYEMSREEKRIQQQAKEMEMDEGWVKEEMRKADNLAKSKAVLYVEQTQQSGNPAMLAPAQTSKNFLLRSVSLYKNSNLGFVRKFLEGARDVARYMINDTRQAMINEYTRRLMQERGLTLNEAKKNATSYSKSQARKAAVSTLMFGWVLNLIWEWGSRGLLGMMAADDDDDKKTTLEDVTEIANYVFMPLSGIPVVDWSSELVEGRVPMTSLTFSQIEEMSKEIKNELEANGISQELGIVMVNHFMRFGGVDLEVFANSVDGWIRMMEDTGNADDKILALMLILNSPKSNRISVARELYKGESEEEFQRAIELAGRYNQPPYMIGNKMTERVLSDMAKWYISDNATEEEKARFREVQDVKMAIENAQTQEDLLKLFDEVSDTELRKKISNKIDQMGKSEDTFAEKVDRKKENALAEDDADMSGYTYMKMADSQDLLDEKRLRAEIDMLSAVVERQKELFEKHGSESEIYTTYMAEHGVEIRRYHTLQAYHGAIQTRKRKMDEEGADVNALYEKIKELYSDARNM